MAPDSDQFLAQNHTTTNSIANVQAVSANRNHASAFTATFHGGSLFKQTAWVKPQSATTNGSTTLLAGSQSSGVTKPFAPPLAPQQQASSFPLNIGTLPAGKDVIRLSGIAAREADATCKDARGKSWPCGAAAKAALTRLIRSRAVTCTLAKGEHNSFDASCSVGDTDLSTWLVRQGWATPQKGAEPELAKALDAAKSERLGLWQSD